ncbi:hypothetical protein [Sphingomonas sp. PB4P5]|uniref:hypothetical protein n=1 Tax=Parasphingomonas puruogangriensis TaxID=3096155 RepID=UPI002FCAF4A1
MTTADYANRLSQHRTILSSNLNDLAVKLTALAPPHDGPRELFATQPKLMNSYAYTAARNELAGLVKLIERGLAVARHCEQPAIIDSLARALSDAVTARNDLIDDRRQSLLVDGYEGRAGLA